jgi:hypothetical protein
MKIPCFDKVVFERIENLVRVIFDDSLQITASWSLPTNISTVQPNVFFSLAVDYTEVENDNYTYAILQYELLNPKLDLQASYKNKSSLNKIIKEYLFNTFKLKVVSDLFDHITVEPLTLGIQLNLLNSQDNNQKIDFQFKLGNGYCYIPKQSECIYALPLFEQCYSLIADSIPHYEKYPILTEQNQESLWTYNDLCECIFILKEEIDKIQLRDLVVKHLHLNEG